MSRAGAIAVAVGIGLVFLGALAGFAMDPADPVAWGVTALIAAFAMLHYIAAIRWADGNQAWPRRRTYRRHRARSP
jgi:hypothetical protein